MTAPTALPPRGRGAVGLLGLEPDRDHGHQRRVGQCAELEEVAAHRPAAHGRTTSLIVVLVPADRPEPLDRPALRGEPTRAGDGLVDDRPGCVERQRGGLVAYPAGQRAQGGPRHPGGVGGEAKADRNALTGGRAGSGCRCLAPRPGGAAPTEWGHVPLVGVGGEHALDQSHRGDAVDEGVVHLGVHRDAAVPSPSMTWVSHSGRSSASRVPCSQPQRSSRLTDPSRAGQSALPDVVVDVELVVLDPDPLAAGGDRAVEALQEQGRVVVRRALGVHVPHVARRRPRAASNGWRPPTCMGCWRFSARARKAAESDPAV